MDYADKQKQATGWLVVGVLYRSAAIGFAVMTLSAVPVLLLTDQIYAIHNWLIAIERPAYNLMMFRLLGEMKILVLVFFLIPAIGLHWTLAKARQNQSPAP